MLETSLLNIFVQLTKTNLKPIYRLPIYYFRSPQGGEEGRGRGGGRGRRHGFRSLRLGSLYHHISLALSRIAVAALATPHGLAQPNKCLKSVN